MREYDKIRSISDKQAKQHLVEIFKNNAVPEIIRLILDDYDSMLNGVVTNKNSRLKPEFFMDSFKRDLIEFNFITIDSNSVSLICPDLQDNRLKLSDDNWLLDFIFDGTSNKQVELLGQDYFTATNLRTYRGQTIIKDESYLFLYGDAIKWKKILKDKIIPYPLSGIPPIDIFASANTYVNNNIGIWIEIATKKTVDAIYNTFGGRI